MDDDLRGRSTQVWSLKKEELVESIESVLEEFSDYMRLAGSDGIFSQEIYHYLLALENLIENINGWNPTNVVP